MHTEVLAPAAAELFPSLSAFQKDFYLAGGTGLALQVGHRVSVDFDLFSAAPVKRTLLKQVEETYPDALRAILVSNRNELTMMISGVKFTFLHYPFRVLLPLTTTDTPIPILSVKETLAAKAYTIGRRGELKDYVDLYTGLRGGYTFLGEVVTLARKKYGDAFNDRLFLEQLVYLDDVEETQITMKAGRVPAKTDLIAYFSQLVRSQPAMLG